MKEHAVYDAIEAAVFAATHDAIDVAVLDSTLAATCDAVRTATRRATIQAIPHLHEGNAALHATMHQILLRCEQRYTPTTETD